MVAEVVRAEQQALSGVGSTFNPMADKTTVIGQAPIVATSKDNTTNLTKQQATEIISQDADGKRLLKNGKVKVLGSILGTYSFCSKLTTGRRPLQIEHHFIPTVQAHYCELTQMLPFDEGVHVLMLSKFHND